MHKFFVSIFDNLRTEGVELMVITVLVIISVPIYHFTLKYMRVGFLFLKN